MLRLVAGHSEAVIDPDVGAGVVSLVSGGRAILSQGDGRDPSSPFAQGMNLLVPFSNRISQPFAFGGRLHELPRNLEGEAFPIHGDAFQKPWVVEGTNDTAARLRLRDGGIGPYRYEAVVDYALSPDGFGCTVSVTHRGQQPLPYGGGFHPWFPRYARTRLQFHATGFWPEDHAHLPTTRAPVNAPADLLFAQPAPLPPRFVNNALSGWDGTMTIEEPGHRVTLTALGMSTLLLYSPGADAPFFCAEPVLHPVDAHNLPDRPGLIPLHDGETMTMTLSLGWSEM
ncbi:MAG: aldose 1-epimerase [Rubellimicrobium sp.]|nr:aldose 1-epimerase [Rubellimicrobium sp.]